MNDKLHRVVQIAEIIGALAIVLSLIFVGLQVRDNTRFARANAATQINNTLSNYYAQLGMDEEASDLVARGLDDFDSLDESGKQRFSLLMFSAFSSTNSAMAVRDEMFTGGEVTGTGPHSIEAPLVAMLRKPGFRQWWESDYRLPAPLGLEALIASALGESGN